MPLRNMRACHVRQSLRRVLSTLFKAMDPNPDNHIFGFGDYFYNTELLSPTQLFLRLQGFLGACLPRMLANRTSLLYCTYHLLRRAS